MRALACAGLLAGALGGVTAAFANVAPPYDSNTRMGTVWRPGEARPPPTPPPAPLPAVPPIDAGFVDRLELGRARADAGAPRR